MAIQRTGRTATLCIMMCGALLLALPAHAQDGLGGSVAATTDYIYRGISQTRGEPALQGGLQLQSPSGWSVGIWGSTVRFAHDVGSSYEIDVHAARAWSLGPDWSTQFGITHYEYLNDPGAGYDYDEISASVSFQQRITASIAWSPNASRYSGGSLVRNRHAVSYELTILEPVARRWSLAGGAGYYDLRDLLGAGYWFWNAGLAFTWDALQADFMYIDTDATAGRLFEYPANGARWTAALTWRF